MSVVSRVLPLVALAAILGVPLLSALGVWLVARRFQRRTDVPRFVPRVAYAFAAVAALVIAWGGVGGVLLAMSDVSCASEGPSQKARVLAEGISEAMNCSALGFLMALAGGVWLGLCAWRWRTGGPPP